MKRFFKQNFLSICALVLGIVAAALRFSFLSLEVDERGLLPTGHILDTLSWVSVAGMMAVLFFGLRRPDAPNTKLNPGVNLIGSVLPAVAFLITSLEELGSAADLISYCACILGIVAAIALLLVAWCRFIDSKPHMLLHALVCIYLMFYLVSHYRAWSAFPQLQSYAFELLAIVFSMLASYQRAARELEIGSRNGYIFFSTAALFFTLAALPGCDNPVFFVGCALWMLLTPYIPIPAAVESTPEEGE